MQGKKLPILLILAIKNHNPSFGLPESKSRVKCRGTNVPQSILDSRSPKWIVAGEVYLSIQKCRAVALHFLFKLKN
jgi:hypothetical protein